MTFVSFAFLLFIAAVVLVYFLTPKKFRWCVLLAASCFFYWLNSKWLLLILVGTAAVTYGAGLWIYGINTEGKRFLKEEGAELSKEEKKTHREKTKKKTKLVLILGILIDLGALLFLKYWNFFVGTVNPLLSRIGLSAPRLQLLLPLGISFYTLQALAYMIDIYRGKDEPDRNPAKFLLFMSFFPQIIQGPIARHNQLAHQLYEGHSFDYNRFCKGMQLMLWGLFKKLVIADRAAPVVTELLDSPDKYNGLIVFFGAALYGIQVYTDFSGGMDIARGVAQIFGIELELNFNQPYFSHSIEEFWRRWHITLGAWMRDYVFYSLSLSKGFTALGKRARKILGNNIGKKIPPILSMFVVYFLVGAWHGSSWKYVAYGLWNSIFIMSGIFFAEGYVKAKKLCRIDDRSFMWRLFQIARTFVICSFGRYFSRAKSFMTAIHLFQVTFIKFGDLSFLLNGTLKKLGLDTANWFLLIAALLVLTLVDYLHERGVHIRDAIARQHVIFRWLIYITAIVGILIFGIYGPGYDAASFIYGQF